MDTQLVFAEINKHIKALKTSVENLNESGRDIPAIARNVARIKASVKMLELNVSDVLDIAENDLKA